MIKQMGALAAVAFSMALPFAAHAATPEELAKSKACLACHAIDKKIVGPAYKDVAAKYKGDPKAVEMLVAKVKNGGKGVWGPIPMPPQNVSDEEAHILVKWVLSH